MASSATPRVAGAASLVVGLVGVAVFGSYVLGIGGDAEGRQFGTVAAWALPGLTLAALTAAVAVRALLQRAGHRIAAALAVAVAASIVLVYVVNLPVAPPVP